MNFPKTVRQPHQKPLVQTKATHVNFKSTFATLSKKAVIMATKYPAIAQWYKDRADQQCFEVVAIDDASGTIDIQYLDGDLAEFDFDIWRQLELTSIPQPEDAASGYEISREDQWGADAGWATASNNNPLAMLEPESFQGTDDI